MSFQLTAYLQPQQFNDQFDCQFSAAFHDDMTYRICGFSYVWGFWFEEFPIKISRLLFLCRYIVVVSFTHKLGYMAINLNLAVKWSAFVL